MRRLSNASRGTSSMICSNNDPAMSGEQSGTEFERPRDHLTCAHCHETILEHEPAVPLNAGALWMHQECIMRGIVGSVGHQTRNCGCYGRYDDSEDGLSLREAAIRAATYWRANHPELP